MTPIRSMTLSASVAALMAAGLAFPSQSAAQAQDLEALVPQELEGYTLENVDQQADAAIQVLYEAENDGEPPVNMILAYGGDGQGLYQQIQSAIEMGDMDAQEIEVGEKTFVGFKDGTEFIAVDHFDGFTLAVGYTDVDAEAPSEDLAASVGDFLEAFDPQRVAEADPPGDMEAAGDPEAADGAVCPDMDCFAQRVSECQEAEVGASLGPGLSALYAVEGAAEGNACRISFEFTDNPNPEIEGEPLFFTLPGDTPWSEAIVQEVMEGCLGGDEEALETYHCEGPLLEAM